MLSENLSFITDEFKCLSSTIKFIIFVFLYYPILVDTCVAYFEKCSYITSQST